MKKIKSEYCLRCKNIKLEVLPDSTDVINFYSCPKCLRHYAKEPGQLLCDRWLSPLSLVLYPIIFDSNPQSRVKEIADLLKRDFSQEKIEILINEINDELNNPKQKLKDILNFKASEQNIREFLILLRDNI